MNVSGWIGIGSLAVVGAGVCWSMLYNLRDSLRREVAPAPEAAAAAMRSGHDSSAA